MVKRWKVSYKTTDIQYYEQTDEYYDWTDKYHEWISEYYRWITQYYKWKNEYCECDKSIMSNQASNNVDQNTRISSVSEREERQKPDQKNLQQIFQRLQVAKMKKLDGGPYMKNFGQIYILFTGTVEWKSK